MKRLFRLDHDDFLQSNIMVDEICFVIIGVIDWDRAFAAPWGLIGFPGLLSTMSLFRPAQKDGPHWHSLGEGLRETWRERGECSEMVNQSLLLVCLSRKGGQTITYSYGTSTGNGNLGCYDQIEPRFYGQALPFLTETVYTLFILFLSPRPPSGLQ
jgi:hypothetical protein